MGKAAIKNEIKEEIIRLRKNGYSIPEMHRILNVSKSTVCRYAKNIEILPEFKHRWLERKNASKIISERAWKVANKTSEDLVNSLNEKELKLIGAALYWAEGAKREFSFINSDPEMVRVFVQILINAYKIPRESIQISLRLFEDILIPDAIKFWATVTDLELSPDIQIEIRKGYKKGKLPYGMCRVRVRKGGLLLKTIFAINKRVCKVISS